MQNPARQYEKDIPWPLSKENNYAQLAYETVKLEIQLDPVEYMPQDFDIQVAERDCISGICNILRRRRNL